VNCFLKSLIFEWFAIERNEEEAASTLITEKEES